MSTQTPTRDGTVLLSPADAARVANVSRDTSIGRSSAVPSLSGTSGASFGSLEGRKAIDTERSVGLRELRREWDRLRFELAVGDLDLDAIEAAREPEPAVPTMGELREQAKALGIPAPPLRRGSADWFRDDMLELLSASPEPVAAKSLPLPVQIASFDC